MKLPEPAFTGTITGLVANSRVAAVAFPDGEKINRGISSGNASIPMSESAPVTVAIFCLLGMGEARTGRVLISVAQRYTQRMGKLGGIILLSALALSGCAAAPTAEPAPTAKETTVSASQRIAPLLAAPAPAKSVAPEFDDESAQGKYLAGVKRVWRGDIPSDEFLLKAGGAGCTLLSEGKTWADIGGMAGPDPLDIDNAAAAATYASRTLCTQYNTDR